MEEPRQLSQGERASCVVSGPRSSSCVPQGALDLCPSWSCLIATC